MRLVEGVTPTDRSGTTIACVAGLRQCPPEDGGGVCGYAEFLDALADPSRQDDAAFGASIERDFDPDAFSLAGTDAKLASPSAVKRGSRGAWSGDGPPGAGQTAAHFG